MKRRAFLGTAGLALGAVGAAAGVSTPTRAAQTSGGTTFLVAHGAWSAGWAWKKMHPIMTAAGHRLITPTYTGLGEREHLANPSIDLGTHIQDMLGVIRFEELNHFVLIGHSYGGMVATGVADRVPDKIRKLIYLDAFVPRDGQSLADLVGKAGADGMKAGAEANDGWRVPASAPPPDTSPEDMAWIGRLRMAQPLKTFETPVRLRNGDTKVPRAYIYAQRKTPVDTFKQFADRARKEKWDYREIDASHSPHITAPDALAALLQSIVGSA